MKFKQFPTLFATSKNTLLLCLIFNITTQAQVQSNRFFNSGNEIVVDVLPGNDIIYSHSYDEGINIYSLAEIFQVDSETLFSYNNVSPSLLVKNGKIVKIPISKKKLITTSDFQTQKHPHINLVYTVKKGETIYKIAKDYFDSTPENIKIINKLNSNDIGIGDRLIVARILIPSTKMTVNDYRTQNPIKNITKPLPTIKEVLSPPNKKVEIKTLETIHEKAIKPSIVKYYTSNVIAMWDKKSSETLGLFVLHNEAKQNTTMDIYFPMSKKHVKAKVIGKIPLGTYADDISLMVSPSVAKELGILDSRFMVNIKYEQ